MNVLSQSADGEMRPGERTPGSFQASSATVCSRKQEAPSETRWKVGGGYSGYLLTATCTWWYAHTCTHTYIRYTRFFFKWAKGPAQWQSICLACVKARDSALSSENKKETSKAMSLMKGVALPFQIFRQVRTQHFPLEDTAAYHHLGARMSQNHRTPVLLMSWSWTSQPPELWKVN